jgi:hypothetical protein
MTKFEFEVEKLAREARAAREERINAELLYLLSARTKEETLAALYEGLTFVSGIGDVVKTDGVKTLVF